MSGSSAQIAARMQGDDYQSRWFFIQALRMLEESAVAVRVDLEQGNFPWFDDIVTHYRADARRVRRRADAHQIKFHTVANGALSFENMMRPDFMGSTTTSLLKRIVEAHRAQPEADVVLMSPWPVQHDDLLAKMAQTGTDGLLRLPLLFDGKTKSNAANIRAALMAHAGIEDTELQAALDHFRIEITPSLPRLQENLDDKLARHGFATVGPERLANVYDDLVRKLVMHGPREFDKAALLALLQAEGFAVTAQTNSAPTRVGIRSFLRLAEYLDEFTTLLDLLDAFNGRILREDTTWSKVDERVGEFMTTIDGARNQVVEMHLSCHSSIVFVAGRAVSPKSGTRYLVQQPGQGGTQTWDLSSRASGTADDFWRVDGRRIREDAPDLAVVVALTRDIASDVETYVRTSVPSVGRMLVFAPADGAAQTAVRDGSHAAALAETFDQLLHDARTPEERAADVHLFVAAPNAFTFALGRFSNRLPRATLYEFDFERADPLGYSPSIAVKPR